MSGAETTWRTFISLRRERLAPLSGVMSLTTRARASCSVRRARESVSLMRCARRGRSNPAAASTRKLSSSRDDSRAPSAPRSETTLSQRMEAASSLCSATAASLRATASNSAVKPDGTWGRTLAEVGTGDTN